MPAGITRPDLAVLLFPTAILTFERIEAATRFIGSTRETVSLTLSQFASEDDVKDLSVRDLTGERPVAPVYEDGEKTVTLKGERIAEEFQQIVADYSSMQVKIPAEFWAELKDRELIEQDAPVPGLTG